jgi:hypothetical protein
MLKGIAAYAGRHHLALLALFLALGGTSFAAGNALLPRNSVGTPQLRNGAVTKTKIANKTLVALNTGPAGGALAGRYPNPTIGAGRVRAATLGPIVAVTETGSITGSGVGGVVATCPAGSVLFGGGGSGGLNGILMNQSKAQGNGWAVNFLNTTSIASTVTAYAYCLAS